MQRNEGITGLQNEAGLQHTCHNMPTGAVKAAAATLGPAPSKKQTAHGGYVQLQVHESHFECIQSSC
jgi:hypothetical protein